MPRNHTGMNCYCTSSPLMSDDLQELVLKSGNYASVSRRDMKGQSVYIQNHWAVRTSAQYNVYEWRKPTDIHIFKRQMQLIPYSGLVYDVEVLPHHLIYVRRDGKCMWSGNSGVYDRLREQKVYVNGIIAGGEPQDKEHYVNIRAEMYDNLRKRFEAGTISIPDDQDLIAQLSSIRFKIASDKKLQIISKEDMKRVYHLKSPDKADSLALCFYEPKINNPSIRWL